MPWRSALRANVDLNLLLHLNMNPQPNHSDAAAEFLEEF
jgi:hypothetical protein